MNDKPDEPANSGGPEQVDSAAQSAQAGSQQLAELKAENADLRDRLLRSIAEMENLRRRTEREKADTVKYAVSEFARDAVTIGDNLRRAIEAAQKETLELEVRRSEPFWRAWKSPNATSSRCWSATASPASIPWARNSILTSTRPWSRWTCQACQADIVVQVLHAGYKIADRILRPAAVIVAKGGTPARPEPIHTESQQDHARAGPPPGGDDGDAGARARTSSMHINVMGAENNDPDVVRGPRGAPRGANNNNNNAQSRGRDRPWAEKRGSTMTRPISEDSGPMKKDDLMSSFGKRPDKD